jgi:predicted DNA binding CopG/RHH family protein
MTTLYRVVIHQAGIGKGASIATECRWSRQRLTGFAIREEATMNSEKQQAAELQGSKDDAEEWEDAEAIEEPEPTPKRRLAAMVSVRLSQEELEGVQARASERGESVSAYLRGLALRDIKPKVAVGRWPVLITSSEVFVSESVSSPIVATSHSLPTRAS